MEEWQRHRTGAAAALVAYYGFVSVFPLLAVMVTILGWVLEDNPRLQKDIVDSALTNIPIIGQQLANDPTKITGSVPVLVLGLLTALWAGTKAFATAQRAMDDTWDVPADHRPNVLSARGRSLAAAALVGLAQIGSATILTVGVTGLIDVPLLSSVALLVGAFAVNLVTVAAIYRILTTAPVTWRDVVPGAVVAAVAFTVLQFLGTAVVGRAISRSSDVYGTFATVIALIFWLSLHATATLFGVELNAVLRRRHTADSPAPA